MPVRLPLQVGTTSLWGVARAGITLAPGLILLFGALLALFGKVGDGWYIAGAAGAVLVIYALVSIGRAWRTRASDVIFDANGLSLEGGSHHGLRVAFSDIDPSQTRTETVREARFTLAGFIFGLISAVLSNDKLEATEELPIRRLHLVTRDGRKFDLAEAEHPDEQTSLDALMASIQARLAPEPASIDVSPEVFTCTSCGAPVAPADQESLPCRFCGNPNQLPATVRERLRAQAQVAHSRQSIARTVEQLLRQPGARRASAVLMITAVASGAPWLLAVIVLFMIGFTQAGGFEIGWLLVCGGLAATAAFMLARIALANRRALHLVTLGFGARTLPGDQGGYACRRCGGPLPDSVGSIVARCAYCDADNVLGLDLGGKVASSMQQQADLESALKRRSHERWTWLIVAVGAVFVALLASVMALASYLSAQEHAQRQALCAQDDAQACYDLAVDFHLGISVGEDEEKATPLYRKACKLGHAEACSDLSDAYYFGWGVMEDEQKAAEIRAQACKMGWQEACKERGE